jgi:hypothetical protein
MSAETKNCQNCHKEFQIEPDDFTFYEKIGVPPPTWCPSCRNLRRMLWREERTLYRDICKLCGKAIITVHAPAGPFTVYCRECYKSDKWDPLAYGRDYDFSRPFFPQYRELIEAVPRPALTGNNLVNSEFTHASESVKNCHYVFWSYFSENAENCYALLLSKNAFDCYVVDNSDLVHDSLHCNRLYKVRSGYFSDDCLDSSFIFDCAGCSDCFGCINMRKQKYCLWNEKLSKEEYFERLKYWDMGSYAKLREAKEKFRSLYLSLPHRFAHVVSSQNVTGDIIRDTKNCKTCFSALDGVENCKFLYLGGLGLKDSYDVSGGGDSSELLYEIFGVTGHAARSFFSAGSNNCREIWYSDWVFNSSRTFGCISLKNKQHCILNKQYAKEEYEALVSKIKRHMSEMPYVDKKGRVYSFGEFFPPEFSAYAYNEAFAFPWYPRTKEEVLAEGWQWREPQKRQYQTTVLPKDLPDHVRDAEDSITEEVIGCEHEGACNQQCTTAFRITPNELDFYRRMNVALPRLCPNCRNAERLKWRNNFTLWHRNCMCDKRGHFHADKSCPNEFETTFSPEKPEIVYCSDCYRSEYL